MNRSVRVSLGCGILVLGAAVSVALRGQEPAPQAWAGWRGPNLDLTVADSNGIKRGQNYRFEVIWKKYIGKGYSAISVSDGIAVTGFSDEAGNYVGAFDAGSGDSSLTFSRSRRRLRP